MQLNSGKKYFLCDIKYLNIHFNFHITACKLSQFLPHDKKTRSHDTNSTHTERGAHWLLLWSGQKLPNPEHKAVPNAQSSWMIVSFNNKCVKPTNSTHWIARLSLTNSKIHPFLHSWNDLDANQNSFVLAWK